MRTKIQNRLVSQTQESWMCYSVKIELIGKLQKNGSWNVNMQKGSMAHHFGCFYCAGVKVAESRVFQHAFS